MTRWIIAATILIALQANPARAAVIYNWSSAFNTYGSFTTSSASQLSGFFQITSFTLDQFYSINKILEVGPLFSSVFAREDFYNPTLQVFDSANIVTATGSIQLEGRLSPYDPADIGIIGSTRRIQYITSFSTQGFFFEIGEQLDSKYPGVFGFAYGPVTIVAEATVPEPSTLAILGISMVGLVATKRRGRATIA